jgi:hypothetical protein
MEPIYLEPDIEITSVIDALSTASGGKVAIVVPKNSTLFQSLVNLKLLAKQAKESNKEVVLITGNKVGQRLASQVGIEAYATLGTIKSPPAEPPPQVETPKVEDETLPDGTPIHRYVPPNVASGAPVAPSAPLPEEPPASVQAAEPIVAAPSPVEPVPATPEERDELKPETVPEEVKQEARPTNLPPTTEELPAIVSRFTASEPRPSFRLPWKSLAASALLLLLAFAFVYFLLPKATVTVTLPAHPVTAAVALEAKTLGDGAESTIAGNLLLVEKSLSKQITATGKQDIGTKATGSIPFRNCEDTNAHPVPAGSKISAAGKTFVTNSAATVPAGSFSGGGSVCNSSAVNIGLTAAEAGAAHNLSNTTFTINGLSSRISGTGSTTGGTTKQVTVLSQEDVDTALAELEKQATEEGTAELRAKAESQTVLADSLIETVKERQADKSVGTQTESATVKLVSEFAVIVFNEAAAVAKLTAALEKQLEEGQRLEIPEETGPILTFKEYSADKTVLSLEVTGSGYGVPDVGKREIARSIRHKSKSEAERQLKSAYGAEEVGIDISPSWWFARLPILGQAISVEYGFQEKLEPPTEAQEEPEQP